MTELYITDHAADRSRERLGLPKKAVTRNADKALREGITAKDTSGSLRRYLDKLYFRSRVDNIRVYGEWVYIFNRGILITVLPLPNKYKDTARRINNERKG